MLEDVLQVVDTWFQESLRCAPLSQDTPAYNQVYYACTDLKVRFQTLLAPAADAASLKKD